MAVGWALLMRLQFSLGLDEAFFLEMAKAGVFVNIGLMALNLLPVPPLDGGRILIGLLPPAAAVQVARIEPYGMFVVLGLIVAGLVKWLSPFGWVPAVVAGAVVGVGYLLFEKKRGVI